MKLFLILASLILSGNWCIAQPQLADKIAGIVDDRMVLWSEVEAEYFQFAYQSTGQLPPDLRCQILDQLLTDKLLIRQAEIDSIIVSDEQVEQELESRIRYYASAIGSIEKLEEYYGKSIVEIKDEFRDQIRDKQIADKERSSIVEGIKVTPSDVASFYNSIPKDSLPYFNSEVEVGQLVIYPKVNEQVKAYSKERIEELLRRVKNGEDFAGLANVYSKDPGSAEQGGDLGFVNRGELDPNFEAAAFALKTPNQVSEVVESQFGYHIIQLIERRGDRIHIRHILIKSEITSYDIAKAGKYADSIYNLVQEGKYTFEQAVNKFSEDDVTKGNGGLLQNQNSGSTSFEIAELGSYDQTLVPATDTLGVGAVTLPLVFRTREGETGFRILYLKSRTKPHQANLKDDYDRIQQFALTRKQVEAIQKWIEDRIEKSYIFITPEYRNCKAIQKWINNEQQ